MKSNTFAIDCRLDLPKSQKMKYQVGILLCSASLLFVGCSSPGLTGSDTRVKEAPSPPIVVSTDPDTSTSTDVPVVSEPIPDPELAIVVTDSTSAEPAVPAVVDEVVSSDADSTGTAVDEAVEEVVVAAPETSTSSHDDERPELTVTTTTGTSDALPFERPAEVSIDRQALTFTPASATALWNDGSESKTGRSCSTCHSSDGLYKDSFLEDYPHRVEMVVTRTGIESVDVDEMVNFCRSVSMEAPTLAWNSTELLGLSALVLEHQKKYRDDKESMKN